MHQLNSAGRSAFGDSFANLVFGMVYAAFFSGFIFTLRNHFAQAEIVCCPPNRLTPRVVAEFSGPNDPYLREE